MNKIPKIMTLVGIGLVCLSIVLSGFNFTKLFEPYRDGLFGDKQRVVLSAENMESITVDITNGNVIIIPTTEDTITITYFDSRISRHTLNQTDNSITLTQKNNNILFFIGFDFRFMNVVTIEVPEELVLGLNITTVNAKIEVSDLTVNESRFRTTNGSITISDLVSEDYIELRTINGKLNAENIAASSFSMITTNGRITADRIDAYTISLTSTNGRISGSVIGDADDFQKEMRTTNGSITVNGATYGNRLIDSTKRDRQLIARTTNGSIEFNFR